MFNGFLIRFRILELIPSPELKKLMQEILQIQIDIDITEREKYNTEKKLSDLETDFKLIIKKNSNPVQKSTEMRSEIENKRNELTGLISQIGDFYN